MKKNEILLKIGLVLMALSLIFCIGIAFYLKLDNPVFFKNYKEIYLYKTEDGRYQDADFTLQYFTNSSDTRTVSDIYVNGAPDLDFQVSEYDFWGWWPIASKDRDLGKILGRYSLRTVYVKMYTSSDEFKGDMEIDNVVINFDNGDIYETNIGKIILKEDSVDTEFVSRNGGTSSSSGNATSDYFVTKNIILEKLDSPFLEYLKDNVRITIGGKDIGDISGMEYKAGERFTIRSNITIPEDLESKYTSVQLEMDLYFKDSEGKTHKTKAHYIHYEPYRNEFKFKDIISYLKSRGEI